MKEVVFANNLNTLRALGESDPADAVRYFVIDQNTRTDSVIKFLRQDKSFVEIDSSLLSDFRKGFSKKFVNFIADLNRANQSLFWWALNFTNKNPISTPLCDEVFQVLSVVHLILNKDIERLLVITDNAYIVKQFARYAVGKQIKVIRSVSSEISMRELVMKRTPAGVVYAFVRMAGCSIYAKLFCPIKLKKKGKQTAIFSILSQKSFDKTGRYCDVYFGKFLDYLHEKGRDFISVVIVRPREYKEMLRKAWVRPFCHSRENGNPYILPLEYFLRFKDLLVCFWHGVVKYFSPVKIAGRIAIDDVNFTYLVKKNIRKDYETPFFFDNLRIYYAVKSFAKRVSLDKFFYPFENRPFEKMIVLALKKVSDACIVGYQHASISLRHTNFLLAEGESTFTPLPDSIITMGEETKKVLEKYGKFPSSLLKAGCALRQAPFRGELKPKKDEIKNIFVALATNIAEYVEVIRFLNEALKEDNRYNIWIRPHPVFSLEDAITITGRPVFTFHKADNETLDECYAWADIILYVHSTLSIEALARGIPAVNLKINSSLNPDPLFSFNDFKWIAEDPNCLIPRIKKIEALSVEEFFNRRQKGADYAKNYFAKKTRRGHSL
ncbi:MAG: hypothetical protein ABH844_04080 [Candidatus Omnitrophota bacterium]